MTEADVYNGPVLQKIQNLIEECGGDPASFEADLITQIIQNSLRLISAGYDIGQLKVITRSLKEMRHAYRVFNRYKNSPCISIFGSARTPENHPDYIAAKTFSALMVKHGWMCITGAANGIMKAGLEGAPKNSSFGLSIRLPFEVPTNTVIEGDPKLIIFRYFFTRKLMFMSHSHALAAFPGGVGTLDELFEMLTLIQTGKTNVIPIVLVEGLGGNYWQEWQRYINDHLLKNGWISPEDERLYYLAADPEDAVRHVIKFYSRYHSSRYIKDILVIRLQSALSEDQIQVLNEKYKKLIASGMIAPSGAFLEETDHLNLPRLAFHHTRNHFGVLRMLIDDINAF